MSTIPAKRATPGDRLVLGDVSWQRYLQVLRAFDCTALRITYDRGAMEIMTISSEHDWFKMLLGYLVLVLVEELGEAWNIKSMGSMTLKRKKRQKGLEADQSYWIQNEPAVRGKQRLDMRHDPPPDLVLEVEWTRSVLNRMGIYAALRVPEVWQYDGQTLRVQLLGPDRHYAESPTSLAFPFLPIKEVERFLQLRATLSETDVVRKFRAWVRERIAAGWN